MKLSDGVFPGAVFGRLRVIRQVESNKHSSRQWECACECGRITVVVGCNLRSGKTKSCSCLQGDIVRRICTKHGHARRGVPVSPEYRVWSGIVQRCTNQESQAFRHYGARGIAVCSQWRASFSAFIADVGQRPSPQHSLDRFPNNAGNYEPGNVRWATRKEQARNTKANHFATVNGERRCIGEWAEVFGTTWTGALKKLIQMEAAL